MRRIQAISETMRVKDLGGDFSVMVPAADVEAFKDRWPGSELPDRAITFTFQKSNGDLVDVYPSGVDGEDARALSQDAQNFGAKKLGLGADAMREAARDPKGEPSMCSHIIRHAVTDAERKTAKKALDYARSVGDSTGTMIALAQLQGCPTERGKVAKENLSMNLRAANESLTRLQRQVMERSATSKTQPDLVWDTTDIWQAHVEYLMNEPLDHDYFFSRDYDLGKIRDDSKSDKEFLEKVEAAGFMDKLKKLAEKDAAEDSDIYQLEWDGLTDAITDWMKEQGTDRWVGGVTGFGWRKQEGGSEFRAKTGKELLQKVLPQTDNRFEVYLEKDQIRIENWHHDAPTGGEWYTIKPATGDEGE